MRKRLLIVVTTVAAGMLAILPVVASASSAVLTSGGSPVQPGAQLVSLAAGGVTFTPVGGGAAVATCSTSEVTATVLTNPTSPGTATLSVTSFSFGGCTGAQSVSFDNLPYAMSVSDVTSPSTVTLHRGDSGPMRLELVLRGPMGPVHCVYEPQASPIGTALTANGFRFDVAFDPVASQDIITDPCLKSLRSTAAYGPFLAFVGLTG